MPRSGARRALRLLKWYLGYLYAWSTMPVTFAIYIHLYYRFKAHVGSSSGVWPLLLEASTSSLEYFVLVFHVILLATMYFGYDVEEGLDYMRYCAGVGRLSALALKLALIGLMASAPLVAAKVFMSVVWEPYAVVLCAEMLAQSSRLFVKLCFFSIYVSSFAALAALAIGRASYTIWALMTYFYLFENISPFQRWTPLNAPYIYFSLASPATSLTEVLLLFPVNTLALPFALSALFALYSRGEVKWR